jgi:hypothetical protein
VSPVVHALPSLHAIPSVATGFEQVPVNGAQTPATWHWSLAVQTTGFEQTQTPAWHESLCVQALPSGAGGSVRRPEARLCGDSALPIVEDGAR